MEKSKQKQVREYNHEPKSYKDRDINELIAELHEKDERARRERNERIDKIFREVIIDGK